MLVGDVRLDFETLNHEMVEPVLLCLHLAGQRRVDNRHGMFRIVMIHDTCHIEIAGNTAYHAFRLQTIDHTVYRCSIVYSAQSAIYLTWIEITISRRITARK